MIGPLLLLTFSLQVKVYAAPDPVIWIGGVQCSPVSEVGRFGRAQRSASSDLLIYQVFPVLNEVRKRRRARVFDVDCSLPL